MLRSEPLAQARDRQNRRRRQTGCQRHAKGERLIGGHSDKSCPDNSGQPAPSEASLPTSDGGHLQTNPPDLGGST